MNHNSDSAVHYQSAPESSVSTKTLLIIFGSALVAAGLLFAFLR
jgi:hypothetical protein